MRPSIKDQLKKAGLKSSVREPPKELPIIPGETEIERHERINWMGQAIYHPPTAKRPYRHRYGDVKITEVKKHMERKPIDKESVSYRVLDIASKEQHFTTDQMIKWMPVGTKRASIASALVTLCQAGVMQVSKEVFDGRKHYSVPEMEKRLGVDALYVRFLNYRKERDRKRGYKKGKAKEVTPVTSERKPAGTSMNGGFPSLIEIKITGTVEHIFTFRLGR